MPEFKYQPLNIADRQIRLLVLSPNPGRVKCSLRHVSLSKLKDEYETLSYCWGVKTTRTVKISVNSLDFLIPINLHAALLRLRHLGDNRRPKTLWIDAVCINQSDPIEKKNQVALMGDIYSLSRRVFIWIGEHDALTEWAFKGLTFMSSRSKAGQKFNYYDWKYVQQQSANCDNVSQLSRHPVNLDAVVTGAAFSALFSRPWFRRVWVIQEIVLPPEAVVICGRFQISWDVIAKAQYISKTSFDVDNYLGTMLRFQAWPDNLANDIFGRMMMASHQDATKPRDRIYGLLGMDYQHDQAFIKIDYEVDDTQVFIEFTRAYLERTSNLQVLAICRGCKNKDALQEPYPSWAIDSTYEADKEPLARDQMSWRFTEWEGYPHGFSAGGSIPCSLTFAGYSLGVQGFQFDSVAACSPINSPGTPRYKKTSRAAGGPIWRSATAFYSIYLKGGLSSWQSALSFCQFYLASKKMCEDAGLGVGGTYLPTSQATLDAFWQIIRGPNLPIDHPNAEASARKQFEDFDEMLKRKTDGSVGVKSSASIISAILGNSTYMQLFPLVGMTRHRRFFITKDGYMGLGPREARVGDKIMILQGHQAPILARNKGKHWNVVGDAYVHGIMEGSVFSPGKCELLWFD